MRLDEILKLGYADRREIDKKERVKLYNQMVKEANKRVAKIENYYNDKGSGKSAIPMLDDRKKARKDGVLEYRKFKTKKGHVDITDFDALHRFLNMKSSTVSGIKEIAKERDKRILNWYNKATGSKVKGLSREQYDEIGDILQRMNELRDSGKFVDKYPEEFTETFSQSNVRSIPEIAKVWKVYEHKSGKRKGEMYRKRVAEKTKYEAFRDMLEEALDSVEGNYTEDIEEGDNKTKKAVEGLNRVRR